MRRFIARHQPPAHPRHWFLAGLGGLLGIGVVGALTVYSGNPFLMAPFGASAVLLFSLPESPLSQPAHVVGGHVLGAVVGLVLHALFPGAWWAAALGVGIAIGLMSALRLTHPPAGGNPLVVFASDPHLSFLFFPVFMGSACLVMVACFYHRMMRQTYPVHPD